MKSMKIVVKIITFGLLIYVGLHFLGEYIAQYSEESFRVRTGIYALKDKEGWSEEIIDIVLFSNDFIYL